MLDIRRSREEDRTPILNFIEASGFFRPEERAVAGEVLGDALAAGPEGHYQSFTAEVSDGPGDPATPAGWVCYGPTPCTVGAFDVYWIVVDPRRRRQGIGAALMRFAEARIAQSGGRLIVVETSGRPLYEPTRRFYHTMGYREAARVRDFYDTGDDKVILTKTLLPRA